MSEKAPLACSLESTELRRRLDEISDIGAESLVESSTDGDRHLLRFHANATTRRRLETIVAAEKRCCSFLDLELEDREEQLVLSVSAPGDGQLVAREFVAAFAAGPTDRPERSHGVDSG